MRRIYCMSCNIIVTPEFSRSLKKLAKHYKSMKDDFAYLLDQLRENPWMGTDLGQGLHKIRLSITSKGKGKSRDDEDRYLARGEHNDYFSFSSSASHNPGDTVIIDAEELKGNTFRGKERV